MARADDRRVWPHRAAIASGVVYTRTVPRLGQCNCAGNYVSGVLCITRQSSVLGDACTEWTRPEFAPPQQRRARLGLGPEQCVALLYTYIWLKM